jgi:vitamin B12 transporter
MRIFFIIWPVLAFGLTTPKIVISSKTEASKAQFIDETEIVENLSQDSTGLLIQRLSQVPGVFINQSGGPGQQSTIHIRGSEFRHVLVLIDGIRVNDPSTTSREANISSLNIADVERVEVIKGSQSLLYGSDAIGGIINIITKKKLERNSVTLFSGFAQGGSLSHHFGDEKTDVVLNYQYEKALGISAISKGKERDGYVNRNLQGSVNRKWNDLYRSEVLIKENNQFIEFDNSASDEEGVHAKNKQGILSHKLIREDEKYKSTFRNSLNRTDRPNDFGSSETLYEGIEQVNEFTHLIKGDEGRWLIGMENINESFKQSRIDEQRAYLNSAYLMYDWNSADYFGQVGLRAGSHKAFGEFLTPGFGVGKKIGKHEVSLNVQSGFKAPSLYQLYGQDASFGKDPNKDLAPEKSQGVDISYENDFGVRSSIFYTKVDDVIVNSNTPVNGEYLEISGVEGGYTFIRNDSSSRVNFELISYFMPDKEKMYKRPNERVTFEHIQFLGDRGELNLNIQYVGRRYDQNFNVSPSEDVKLDAYELVNISYKYALEDREFILGVDNLFNERYEMAYGYSTLGQTVYFSGKFFY